jgi:uncharacterized protein YndB with AHSA1/START domain
MGDFSLTITIGQPPAVVFAFLAEPANMPRWYDAVQAVEIVAGAATGVGTRFEIVRSLPGGRAINQVEITDYEPGRRITIESQEGPTPFRYRYTLEPSAAGTRLTLDGRITSAGLADPIARHDTIATQLFKRGMKRNLDVLKDLVESQPTTDRSS